MPALEAGIHANTGGAGESAERAVLFLDRRVRVDGRVKPGHDGEVHAVPRAPWGRATASQAGARPAASEATKARAMPPVSSSLGLKIVMLMPRARPLRMAAPRTVSSSCQREAARQAIADGRHDRIVQHVDVEVDPEAVQRRTGRDARSRRAAAASAPRRRTSARSCAKMPVARAAGCRIRAPARRRAGRAPRRRHRAPAGAGLRDRRGGRGRGRCRAPGP